MVLVVEDDDDSRDILSLLLTMEGYLVIAASCGKDAIALLGRMRQPPQIALVDIVMPGMNGFEFIRRMRECLGFASVPVVVVSGVLPVPSAMVGVADWLVKPPDADALLRTVKRLSHRA